jgi:hypothetical protein
MYRAHPFCDTIILKNSDMNNNDLLKSLYEERSIAIAELDKAKRKVEVIEAYIEIKLEGKTMFSTIVTSVDQTTSRKASRKDIVIDALLDIRAGTTTDVATRITAKHLDIDFNTAKKWCRAELSSLANKRDRVVAYKIEGSNNYKYEYTEAGDLL